MVPTQLAKVQCLVQREGRCHQFGPADPVAHPHAVEGPGQLGQDPSTSTFSVGFPENPNSPPRHSPLPSSHHFFFRGPSVFVLPPKTIKICLFSCASAGHEHHFTRTEFPTPRHRGTLVSDKPKGRETSPYPTELAPSRMRPRGQNSLSGAQQPPHPWRSQEQQHHPMSSHLPLTFGCSLIRLFQKSVASCHMHRWVGEELLSALPSTTRT